MECPKCDTDFEGDVCPNCNQEMSVETDASEAVSEEVKIQMEDNTDLPKVKFFERKAFKIGRIVVEGIVVILLLVSLYMTNYKTDKAIRNLKEHENLIDDFNSMSERFNDYKNKMKPYEDMELAEANAKRIEAEKVAADKKAEEDKIAAEKKAVEDKAVAEAAAKQQAIASATTEQKNALNKAKDYLSYSAFSHSGLIEQLEYEGFSTDSATYAVDNCGADWNVQAEEKAKDYMSYSSFSHSGLVEQLVYEGFTQEQAEHGASAAGY